MVLLSNSSIAAKENFLQLSYSALAEMTGVDAPTWSKWLNGTRSPTLDTLRGVARDLSMSLAEFVEVFEERRHWTIRQRDKQ